MRVAILCPGPSLSTTWRSDYPPTSYDLTIAVNRAILHHRCDWWSVGDWTLLQDVDGRPTAGICSMDDVVRLARGGSLIPAMRTPERFVSWSELPHPHPGYSMIAAIALAVHLGGREIYIYGDDKRGTKDWDGQAAGANRGDERWAKERAVMDNVMAKLTAVAPLSIAHVLHT